MTLSCSIWRKRAILQWRGVRKDACAMILVSYIWDSPRPVRPRADAPGLLGMPSPNLPVIKALHPLPPRHVVAFTVLMTPCSHAYASMLPHSPSGKCLFASRTRNQSCSFPAPYPRPSPTTRQDRPPKGLGSCHTLVLHAATWQNKDGVFCETAVPCAMETV